MLTLTQDRLLVCRAGHLITDRLNARPFRKRPDVSRTLLFQQLDRPALKPLAERYVFAQWKPVRPNIDYHVEIDRHYYSVPYQREF